ncbi:amidase signature domain-containing protein [Xylaria grammica]|nr:amidase signature domain-containing protein [Xylaria grammica]
MLFSLDFCEIIPKENPRDVKSPSTISSAVTLPSGHYYFIHDSSLPLRIKDISGVQPATVINTNGSVPSLKSAIDRFTETDDVFNPDFLSFVVLVFTNGQLQLSKPTYEYLISQGARRVALVDCSSWANGFLNEGPYFATNDGLFRTWKLLPDTHGAFVSSLVQDENRVIGYLNAACADAAPNLTIAVPSRLYYPLSPDFPLNGLRVAIKDNIDIAGAKTFGSCKSYGELYGVSRTTAPAVQRLLDLGAIIVGKTGMSQFADAESPTCDFVDFHAPFNPRGDGNRSAGGSSYGSGAAAAAYDWLDFTVGTDTGGSCRVPAANNCIFGLRPSRGAMTVDGTLIIHRDLDTVGLLSRDMNILVRVAVPFYRLPSRAVLPAPKFIYPLHLFPLQGIEVQQMFNRVAKAIEFTLGVKKEAIDFRQAWKRWRPMEDRSFDEYFASTLFQHVVWGEYHERAKFREEYEFAFQRYPMVNPLARHRWYSGAKMTEKEFEQSLSERQEYQSFIESIFGENTFMLTPFLYMEPEPRDVYQPAPNERSRQETGWGLRQAFQAPMAGQPEIVFPIGLRPTLSNISQVQEKYGIIASIIGTRGRDLDVLELTCSVLDQLEIPRAVLTGRVPFEASQGPLKSTGFL